MITYPTGNYEMVDAENRSLEDAGLTPQTTISVLKEMSKFYK